MGCLTSDLSHSAQPLSRDPLGPFVALTWILGFGELKSVLANPGSFCSSSRKGLSSGIPGGVLFQGQGCWLSERPAPMLPCPCL